MEDDQKKSKWKTTKKLKMEERETSKCSNNLIQYDLKTK